MCSIGAAPFIKIEQRACKGSLNVTDSFGLETSAERIQASVYFLTHLELFLCLESLGTLS